MMTDEQCIGNDQPVYAYIRRVSGGKVKFNRLRSLQTSEK